MADVELGPTACEYTRLQLPLIETAEQELYSIFKPGTEFVLGKEARRIIVTKVSGDEYELLSFCVELTIDERQLLLEMDRSLLFFLLSNIMPEPSYGALPFEQLPSAIQLALLQTAMMPITEDLTAGLLPIELERVRPRDDRIAASGSRLFFQCDWGKAKGYAAITFTEEAIPLIRSHLPAQAYSTSSRTLDIASLPLAYSIEVVCTTLSWQEISRLRARDVVLLDRSSADRVDSDAIAYLFQAQLIVEGVGLFWGLLNENQLEITHIIEDKTMEHPARSNANEALENLDALPLEITFEITRDVTNLQRIKSLATGQLFELKKPLESALTLVVHGQPIAEAELVQINDQLGARITRLLLPVLSDGSVDDGNSA